MEDRYFGKFTKRDGQLGKLIARPSLAKSIYIHTSFKQISNTRRKERRGKLLKTLKTLYSFFHSISLKVSFLFFSISNTMLQS